MESCCTCATLLKDVPVPSQRLEKAVPHNRQLECCGRTICRQCIAKNERFAEYCPYCQISIKPTTLLPQGLKEPPSYSSLPDGAKDHAPPPYSVNSTTTSRHQKVDPLDEKSVPLDGGDDDDGDQTPVEDTLHFLNHNHDTINSLSLAYGVPASVLRRANNITSDHLLAGRRTIIIPGEYYKGGVSLSPRPVEGEEEELRKGKIRRFMVGCKVSEYDVAVLYLNQAGYDLDTAVEAFMADEEWERNHPVAARRGKGAAGVGRQRGAIPRRT